MRDPIDRTEEAKPFVDGFDRADNVVMRGAINDAEGTVVTENVSETSKKPANPVVVKVLSFGVGSVLIAVNLTGNSLMMVSEGHPGAGSLTTSFQSLLLGVCGGALMSGGVALGKTLGEKDLVKAGEIVKASYAMTGALTVFSTLAYGSTYFVFPKLFSADTAEAASKYFLISGIGNWPALALVTTGQMAFQCGDWKSPLVSTILYRLPTVGLSYLLSKTAHLDVLGIGLGNAIAPWVSYVGMELWLRRKEFGKLRQSPFSFESITKHGKFLSTLAAKMSLQRITEWGNLAVITSLLGAENNNNLAIINPSLQFMTLFNLFSQGVGLGGNMLLTVQRAEMKNLLKSAGEKNDKLIFEQLRKAQREIKVTCVKSFLGAGVTNLALAGALFFAKTPIVNLFLSDQTPRAHEIAEMTLWINGLGLVADALRLVSTNLLNTYDKIMLPNIISLGLMTVIGISAVYFPMKYFGNGDYGDLVIAMFAVRSGMIFLSALINSIELYRSIAADNNEIEETIASHQSSDVLEDEDRSTVVTLPATPTTDGSLRISSQQVGYNLYGTFGEKRAAAAARAHRSEYIKVHQGNLDFVTDGPQ
jgi:Na+-driven multidrug efflux pump